MLYSDTEVVVQRELVATKHLRPREAVVGHARFAACADRFAKGATRIDWMIKADRGEQRTEEHLSVLVTANIQQRNPAIQAQNAFTHSVIILNAAITVTAPESTRPDHKIVSFVSVMKL